MLGRAAEIFDAGARPESVPVKLAPLRAKIGQLALENGFLESAHQSGIAERKTMIDRDHELSITRQASFLNIGRPI